MINVLHIAPDLNSNSGVTTYVAGLLRRFSKRDGYSMHLITNGGTAMRRFDGLPFRPVIIPMETGVKNVVHAYANFRLIKKYCEDHSIQLIHTHHRYPELIAYRVSKKMNLGTVTTAHSIVRGFRGLSFRSDKIIAVSNAVRDSIIRDFGVDPAKITMMHNCVERFGNAGGDEKVKMKRLLNIPGHHKVILYLGRFDPIKGVRYLLEAFREISLKRSDLTLLLVGGSSSSAEEEGPAHIVRIPPQENTALLYGLSDLVVLPSEQDPFPYTMLETGLAGKPFVGSRVGGIAEFIEDGSDGLLFTPKNSAELADRIWTILQNSELAARLGANLQRKVEALPDCEAYWRALEALYEEILSAKRSVVRT